MCKKVEMQEVMHECGASVDYPAAFADTAIERVIILRHVIDCPNAGPDQIMEAEGELMDVFVHMLEVVGDGNG